MFKNVVHTCNYQEFDQQFAWPLPSFCLFFVSADPRSGKTRPQSTTQPTTQRYITYIDQLKRNNST